MVQATGDPAIRALCIANYSAVVRTLAEAVRLAADLAFVSYDGDEAVISEDLRELIAEALDHFADDIERLKGVAMPRLFPAVVPAETDVTERLARLARIRITPKYAVPMWMLPSGGCHDQPR